MKIYKYEGLLVQVPSETTHLMFGPDGVLRAYFIDPLLQQDSELQEGTCVEVLTWKKSCSQIYCLQEYAPLVLSEFAAPDTERYSVGDKYTIRSNMQEKQLLDAEVHMVVSYYTPARKPWCQILKLEVKGLSLDNTLNAIVQEVLHDLSV